MIEINPSLAILTAEILAVMVAIMLFLLFRALFQRRGQETAANDLVKHISEGAGARHQELSDTLNDIRADLDPELVEKALNELKASENALYRQVLLLFLRRDPKLLNELEQRVRGLYQPFCQIIQSIPEQAKEDPELARVLSHAEAEILWLKAENARLVNQSQMTRRSFDEISAEYAKMFNGATAKELENSRLRILSCLRELEHGISNPQPTTAEQAV